VDGHVLILTHFHPNFRTFKFTSGKLILGFFCIGVLLQMLQWGTTSILHFGMYSTQGSNLSPALGKARISEELNTNPNL
jgi:hypothetical protein